MTEQSVMPEIDVFNLPVHEDAEIFDMWTEERLDNLAKDIRENGYDPRYPLTISEIDGVWMLIDGRNRREACRRIEFTPPVYVSTIDPKLAIARSNLQNHDQSQGQKAMRWAMIYPGDGQRGGDRKSNLSSKFDPEPEGFSENFLFKARYVWHKNPKLDGEKHPQLAKDVAAGLKTLTEAYKETQIYVKEEAEREKKRKEDAEKLNDLRNRYPDLAALVDDKRMTPSQAIAAAEQSDREAEEKERLRIEEEKERMIREADLNEKVKKIREHDDKLADLVASEEISFEKAISILEEQEATERRSRIGLMTNLNGLITNSYLITDIEAQRKLLKLKGYWVDFQASTQYSIDHVIDVSRKIKENVDSFISVIEELR